MGRKINPARGDVYLVNFDPAVGSEIKKTRPALIIQNDVANTYSPVSIVAAITSHTTDDLYPTEVGISAKECGLDKDSVALLNQLRTVDKTRLIKKLGRVNNATMTHVDMALQVSLGLIEH